MRGGSVTLCTCCCFRSPGCPKGRHWVRQRMDLNNNEELVAHGLKRFPSSYMTEMYLLIIPFCFCPIQCPDAAPVSHTQTYRYTCNNGWQLSKCMSRWMKTVRGKPLLFLWDITSLLVLPVSDTWKSSKRVFPKVRLVFIQKKCYVYETTTVTLVSDSTCNIGLFIQAHLVLCRCLWSCTIRLLN